MLCVGWAEISKTGLRFEIEPSYDDVPMTPQCASDGQSSRTTTVFNIVDKDGRKQLFAIAILLAQYHPYSTEH